jgi:hypothetical protein
MNKYAIVHPGIVPFPPAIIIGRDHDLEILKEKLGAKVKTTSVAQATTIIRGWPGAGKSTIASALAFDPDIARAFPDGVLWVSLGQEPNILSEMASWGIALGRDEILKTNSIQGTQNLLASALRNKRMLLIVDDVWQSEHAIPFNVGGPGCKTLVTTRLNDVARELAPDPENIYLLPFLTDESAMEFMSILAPSVVQAYHDDVLLLVHELEGHPLALQVAGRLLQSKASTGFSIWGFIDEIRKDAELFGEEAPPDRAELVKDMTPQIAALIQKSIDSLDDFTRVCYAQLGVFAPKPATFDINILKNMWQLEDPKPIIRILFNRGLLEYVPELDRYQIHVLLVMFAKSLLIDDEA